MSQDASGVSPSILKRREFIAAVAAGGVIASSGGGVATSHDPPSDVGLGGGSMADALSGSLAELYRWDDSELPDPGVLGRYLHLQQSAGGFSANSILEDQGDSWALVDMEVSSLTTEEATIDTNRSVVQETTYHFAYAVADDGTHYGLRHDSSGTNTWILEKTDDSNPDGWETVNQMSPHPEQRKVSLHITASGSILVGFDGSIRRSIDEGASFTSVHSINEDATIWTFSENGAGDIIATEGGTNVHIYQSTDDGQTWSTLADGTDLDNFTTHAHRARYSPHNDSWIIVNGGDQQSTADDTRAGFYRSTDGGSTWDHFGSWHFWVSIGFHPTDPNTYFLGDDEGPERASMYRVSDDGTTATPAAVQGLNIDGAENTAVAGAFNFRTIDGPEPYYVSSTVHQEPNRILASDGIGGHSWRMVGEHGKDPNENAPSAMNVTTSQGADETTIPSDINHIHAADRIIRTTAAGEVDWGPKPVDSIDERPTNKDIHFGEPGHRLVDYRPGNETATLWDVNTPDTDRESLGVYYASSRYTVHNKSTGQDLFIINLSAPLFDMFADLRFRADDAGDVPGIEYFDKDDLTATGGNLGEIRCHDGSGTDNPVGLYERKDTTGGGNGDTWVEMSPDDGTPNTI